MCHEISPMFSGGGSGPRGNRTHDQPLKRPLVSRGTFRILLIAVISAVVSASQASGQTLVDCSLLTPQQARGLRCAPPPAPVSQVLTSEPECGVGLNAYEFPDAAARCAPTPVLRRASAFLNAQNQPSEPLVGLEYQNAYSGYRLVVRSVLVDGDERVVVGRYTTGPLRGSLVTFIDGSGQTEPWTEVAR